MAKAALQVLILLCLLKSAIVINKQDQQQQQHDTSQQGRTAQDREIEELDITGNTIPIADDHEDHDYFAPVTENLESIHDQATVQVCCTDHAIRPLQERAREGNNTIYSIPSRLPQVNRTLQPYRCSSHRYNRGNTLDQQHMQALELADTSADRRLVNPADHQRNRVVANRHLWFSYAHEQHQQDEVSEQGNPTANRTQPESSASHALYLYSTDFLLPKEPPQHQQERASEQHTFAANGQQLESAQRHAVEISQFGAHAQQQTQSSEEATANTRNDGESIEHVSLQNFFISQPSSEHDQRPGSPVESGPIQQNAPLPQVRTTAVARWYQFDNQYQEETAANQQVQYRHDKQAEEEDQATRAGQELRRHLIIQYDHNGRATAEPYPVFGHDFQPPDQVVSDPLNLSQYQEGDTSGLPLSFLPSSFQGRRPRGTTPRRRHNRGDQLQLPGVRMVGRPNTGVSMVSLLDTVGQESDPLAGMLQRIITPQPSDEYRQLQLQNTSTVVDGHDGTLDWRIHDFSLMMQRAITGQVPYLYSEPFYTLEGYKLVAKIYLNGKGRGTNSHVSLYYVIRRSHNDWHLQWPFRSPVTMTLVDQELGLRDISDTIWPDPNSSSFQRPREEMNIASGSPLFVSHAQLSNSNYIKDDIMYLKFSVDPLQHRHSSMY